MYLDDPFEMQQHIRENHHYTLDNDLKGFSVTFYKNIPRMVYFNKNNWDNISHFKNMFNYRCYVVVHEVLHALGFIYHYDDNYNELNLGCSIPCKIMSQQTRSKYLNQHVSYFNIYNFFKFLNQKEKECVEALLKKNENNKKIEMSLSHSSNINGGTTEEIDYNRWFTSYNKKKKYNTSLDVKSLTSKSNKSSAFEGGSVDFDGITVFSNTQNLTEIPLASKTSKSPFIKSPNAESDIFEQMSSNSSTNSSTLESSSSSISHSTDTMTGGGSSSELTLSTL